MICVISYAHFSYKQRNISRRYAFTRMPLASPFSSAQHHIDREAVFVDTPSFERFFSFIVMLLLINLVVLSPDINFVFILSAVNFMMATIFQTFVTLIEYLNFCALLQVQLRIC